MASMRGLAGKALIGASLMSACSSFVGSLTRLLESLHVPTTAQKKLLRHCLVALLPPECWVTESLSSLPALLQLCSSSDGQSLIRCSTYILVFFLSSSLNPLPTTCPHSELPVMMGRSLSRC